MSYNTFDVSEYPDVLEKQKKRKKIVYAFVVACLTLLYCLAELVFGIQFSSLALLTDGIHNLSGVVGIGLVIFSLKMSDRNSDHVMTYGWKRIEILGALVNGSILMALSFYMTLESIQKIIEISIDSPTDSNCTPIANVTGSMEFGPVSLWMIGFAVGGLLLKLFGSLLFYLSGNIGEAGHSGEHSMDWNIYAVFVHYLIDSILSLVILIAGVLIYFTPVQSFVKYVDPLTGLVLVVLIVLSVIPLVKSCCLVLMQSTPHQVDIDDFKEKLQAIKGVDHVHSMHVWSLDGSIPVASFCLRVHDCDCKEYSNILSASQQIAEECCIRNSCVQIEFLSCCKGDKELVNLTS